MCNSRLQYCIYHHAGHSMFLTIFRSNSRYTYVIFIHTHTNVQKKKYHHHCPVNLCYTHFPSVLLITAVMYTSSTCTIYTHRQRFNPFFNSMRFFSAPVGSAPHCCRLFLHTPDAHVYNCYLKARIAIASVIKMRVRPDFLFIYFFALARGRFLHNVRG